MNPPSLRLRVIHGKFLGRWLHVVPPSSRLAFAPLSRETPSFRQTRSLGRGSEELVFSEEDGFSNKAFSVSATEFKAMNKQHRIPLFSLIALLGVALAPGRLAAEPASAADTIYVGGDIVTMNDAQPEA
jgi:hypothetical protein